MYASCIKQHRETDERSHEPEDQERRTAERRQGTHVFAEAIDEGRAHHEATDRRKNRAESPGAAPCHGHA